MFRKDEDVFLSELKLHFAINDFYSALITCNEALEYFPENEEFQEAKGIIFVYTKHASEAIPILNKEIEK